MIHTEQNRTPGNPAQNGNLGETRTFSVAEHAADSMKQRINLSNEQTLTQKNRGVQPRPQPAGTRQTPPQGQRPAQVRPVQGYPQPTPRAQAQTGAPRPAVPAQAAPQHRAAQSRPAQQRPAQPRPTAEVAPARRQVVPVEAKTMTPRPAARPQMLKTRTDIAPLHDTAADKAVKTEKTKKERRESSGEGGNTVVSLVKAVVYIIFVLVISVFLAMAIIYVGNDIFAFVKSDEMVEVTIPEYATLDEVTDILYQNDIIAYPTVFKLFAVAKKVDNDFLAGTYTVHGMMNYETLLAHFKEKPETGTVDITIPEGYTIDEMIDLFVNKYGIGTREGFVDVIQNGDFDYWFIDELEKNGTADGRIYRLEGYLFPDTYQFYKASSEYTVVNKMLKRFTQIFTKDYRTQCETLGYTVDEMITLASIIEKEAGSPSEFFQVSSVFHNRMKMPWNFPKLESDATVVYVLSHEKGERTGVTAADLDYDTPYNTYLYDGLPPGPIANPSASAMLAAMLPQQTNYYFFVANKGKTYFSETKAEHDAYIAEFRNEPAQQQTSGDIPQEG